jgi:hypothetical protein
VEQQFVSIVQAEIQAEEAVRPLRSRVPWRRRRS